MKRRLLIFILLAVALSSLGVLASSASAAEIVDRNVTAPHLSVNAKGDVALVTYTVKGAPRHVLYWGARNWADRFLRDYSGGWKSKVADYKHFANHCRPYTGPEIALAHRSLRRPRRLALGAAEVGAPVEQLRWRLGAGGALHLALDRRHR